MKNIFSLYKLRMMVVSRSAVLVIPIVAVAAFVQAMYSVTPTQISGSFLLSGLFLFIISAFIALTIQFKENDTHEEIMLLHSKSRFNYYISREMILCSLTLLFAVFLIVYPIIDSALNSHLFNRKLTISDIIYGSLIVIGNGLCGVAVGDLFHQRIINKRRNSIIGLILFALLAICKHPLLHAFPSIKIMNVLNIITPPIMDGFEMVGDTDVFDQMGTLTIFLHMIVFVVVVAFVKIRILMYRKYNS